MTPMTPEEFVQRMELLRKEREDFYMAIIIVLVCIFLCTVLIILAFPTPTPTC